MVQVLGITHHWHGIELRTIEQLIEPRSDKFDKIFNRDLTGRALEPIAVLVVHTPRLCSDFVLVTCRYHQP